MGRFGSILVYDGECPYCSEVARTLRELDEVGAISWYDERAQAYLEAQFGATPFAMVLVDADEGPVYTGRTAAEELADRAGIPDVVGSLVWTNYDRIARAVGLASERGRDPDGYHETYDLTEAGRDAYSALAGSAERRDRST